LRVDVASSFFRFLLRLSNVSVHVPRLKSVTDARRSAGPLNLTLRFQEKSPLEVFQLKSCTFCPARQAAASTLLWASD